MLYIKTEEVVKYLKIIYWGIPLEMIVHVMFGFDYELNPNQEYPDNTDLVSKHLLGCSPACIVPFS